MISLQTVQGARAKMKKYRRLLQREPNSLRFAEYAERLRRAGQVADATAICARGLMRHPRYATGHAVMGEIFRDAGLVDKAEQEWREALRFDPCHPRAHLCLGELYESRGDVAQAVASYEAALLANPSFAAARERLAEVRAGSRGRREGRASTARRSVWRPGKRPEWLSNQRVGELVERIGRCSSVQTAAILGGERGDEADVESATLLPDGLVEAAMSLTASARDLLARLGAGRLRGVLLRAGGGAIRCTTLGNLTLVTTLNADTPAGAAAVEIEKAIAAASELAGAEGDRDD